MYIYICIYVYMYMCICICIYVYMYMYRHRLGITATHLGVHSLSLSPSIASTLYKQITIACMIQARRCTLWLAPFPAFVVLKKDRN